MLKGIRPRITCPSFPAVRQVMTYAPSDMAPRTGATLVSESFPRATLPISTAAPAAELTLISESATSGRAV